MNNVVSLIPNKALCMDAEALASRVEQMADRIRAGEFEGLERVVILLEVSDRVDYRAYGRPMNNMELVGMIEYAKQSVMTRRDDE